MAIHQPPTPDLPNRSRTILVTGFGAFPGSPRNPTEGIVAHLRRQAPRLARLGIDLRCVALPVRYDELQGRLEKLACGLRPDAVLHLGVAGRRRRICVETHARNRAGPLRPDAAGRCPAAVLVDQGTLVLRSTFPSRRILPALRAGGLRAQMSRDAGDYVCNATLYRSLAMALAPEVGFIHVPSLRPGHVRSAAMLPGGKGHARVSQAEVTRAALLAVLVLAPKRWTASALA